jgi:ATP-dependent Clp protease ATP-binding subunit ClpB
MGRYRKRFMHHCIDGPLLLALTDHQLKAELLVGPLGHRVLLLDEIEKAHPDVFNVLLQVLDDGRLTDAKGRTVNFRNTLIIMTSNAGSEGIQECFDRARGRITDEVVAEMDAIAQTALRRIVRPEFLNRIDEVIVFHPLEKAHLRRIVEIQLMGIGDRLKEAGIDLRVSEDALVWLAEAGYSPDMGARPLKRLIAKEVLNRLSKAILSGTIRRDGVNVLDVFDGEVVFRERIADEVVLDLNP